MEDPERQAQESALYMTIEKTPFRMYQSEEAIAKDKAKSRTITIRLNEKEEKMIKDLKKMFSIHTDGTAIKLSMQIGYNVLQGFLGSKTMEYITSDRRVRLVKE